MSPEDIIVSLHAQGVELRIDGDRVRYNSRKRITEEMRRELKARESEIREAIKAADIARTRELVAAWRAGWGEILPELAEHNPSPPHIDDLEPTPSPYRS